MRDKKSTVFGSGWLCGKPRANQWIPCSGLKSCRGCIVRSYLHRGWRD